MNQAKTYECMILLDNREVKSGWEALQGSIQSIFSKHGAEVIASRPWGERRLAYPLKRQSRATYLLNYLKAGPESVAGIRRDLQFQEAVLRNLIVSCDAVPEDLLAAPVDFDPASVQVEDLAPVPAPVTGREEPEVEEASDEPEDAVAAEGDDSDADTDTESGADDEEEAK